MAAKTEKVLHDLNYAALETNQMEEGCGVQATPKNHSVEMSESPDYVPLPTKGDTWSLDPKFHANDVDFSARPDAFTKSPGLFGESEVYTTPIKNMQLKNWVSTTTIPLNCLQ